MIRLAAIADLHCVEATCGMLAPAWSELHEVGDVLLIGGDLTTTGTPRVAAVLARELESVQVPVVAVLGNHDYHTGNEHEVRRILEAQGVHVLEGECATFTFRGETLGVAGTKGFGGGFAGACGTDFGEPEMKQYVRHSVHLAAQLREVMRALDADYRVLLMHYSPIDSTLRGEPLPIYPFLGSYLFAEAADEAGVDMVVHGHAHHGSEKGLTPGGIPVRNVALPLIRNPYHVFHLQHAESNLPFPRSEQASAPHE